MFMRVAVVAICLLLVADLLLFVPLCHFFGWELPVIEIAVSAVIGLLVIGWYEWRWSDTVANQVECAMRGGARTTSSCVEKMLLLLAGVFLILPGQLTDGIGFLLLVPGSRRLIIQLLNLCV